MCHQKGEHIWTVIQATEAHCKHLVPTGHMEEEQLYRIFLKIGLCWKNARFAFHCKTTLGLGFLH